MSLTKKQVIFDLDTNQLKIYFPKENWRYAYEVIKNYMLKNNFKWQQGSSYISNIGMSSEGVNQILRAFIKENPWINLCMRDCKQTNVGREYNQNFLFDKNARVPTREELKKYQEKKEMENLLEELDISMSKEELEDFMRNEVEERLNSYDLERG